YKQRDKQRGLLDSPKNKKGRVPDAATPSKIICAEPSRRQPLVPSSAPETSPSTATSPASPATPASPPQTVFPRAAAPNAPRQPAPALSRAVCARSSYSTRFHVEALPSLSPRNRAVPDPPPTIECDRPISRKPVPRGQ